VFAQSIIGKLKEAITIFRVIRSARRCEEFLWGIYNDDWGLEEWQRMITKRAHKIVKIDTKNPHWKIELQKRLLQNACVSISLMGRIKDLKDGIHPTVESNLKEIHPIMARCKAKND